MQQKTKRIVLYEEVVKSIKEKISAGYLKKGDMLPSENDMAKQYNVSRVTIREALKLLVKLNIIETRKGVGSFVSVDPENSEIEKNIRIFLGNFNSSFEEAISIKTIMDPDIAKYLALKATDEELEKLETLFNITVKTQNHNENYIKAVNKFHMCIVETMNYPVLTKFYKILEEMEDNTMQIMVLPIKIQKEIKKIDIEQHHKILQALKSRNADYAYFYTKEHLDYFHDYYQNNGNILQKELLRMEPLPVK